MCASGASVSLQDVKTSCVGRDGLGRSIHWSQAARTGFLSSLVSSCLSWSWYWFWYENPRNIAGFVLLTKWTLSGRRVSPHSSVLLYPSDEPQVTVCPRRGLDTACLNLRSVGICRWNYFENNYVVSPSLSSRTENDLSSVPHVSICLIAFPSLGV